MAEKHELGESRISSTPEPCGIGNCNNSSREAIWMGDRWQYTCDEHQPAIQDELRPDPDTRT